jgi:hypothetical protein
VALIFLGLDVFSTAVQGAGTLLSLILDWH